MTHEDFRRKDRKKSRLITGHVDMSRAVASNDYYFIRKTRVFR